MKNRSKEGLFATASSTLTPSPTAGRRSLMAFAGRLLRKSYEVGLVIIVVIGAMAYRSARAYYDRRDEAVVSSKVLHEIRPLVGDIEELRQLHRERHHDSASASRAKSKNAPAPLEASDSHAIEVVRDRVQARFARIAKLPERDQPDQALLDQERDLFDLTIREMLTRNDAPALNDAADGLFAQLHRQHALVESFEEELYSRQALTARASIDHMMVTLIFASALGFLFWLLARVVMTLDLREIEAQQEAAHKARQEAEDASRSKSNFLANLSHEIRTPMNAVLGMANLLLRSEPRTDQVEYCETIRQSGRTLLRILQDTLDLSRIEAGKLKLELARFEPRKLLLTVGDIIRPSLRDMVRLKLDVEETVPQILIGDAGRIQQILLNLTSNAAKFTDEGQIHLHIGLAVTDAGDASDAAIAPRIRFTVSDTGLGIPPSSLGDLFQPFSQVSPDSPREKQGTGLGLSICKRFVEIMKGEIHVESEVGIGSRFYFDLPLDSQAQDVQNAFDQETAGPEAELRFDGRALVVDDNIANLKVAELTLRSIGLDVTVCQGGKEAVALARQNFDLIFMDCQMPEVDGFEATRRIRAIEGDTRRTPIIALTAHASQDTLDLCLSKGMDDFLVKPLDFDHLQAVVGRFVTPVVSSAAPPPTLQLVPPPSLAVTDHGSGEGDRPRGDNVSVSVGRRGALDAVRTREAGFALAPSGAGAETHAIDYEILNSLRRLTPPRGEFSSASDVIDELIRLFASSLDRSTLKLHEYAEALDSKKFAEEAHYLKSSSTSIGAIRVTEILDMMESLKTRSPLPPESRALLVQLEVESQKALGELRRWWEHEKLALG